jgi:catechol 2,3-dioxygenase-like lactoylglutathione lyase family enzyme
MKEDAPCPAPLLGLHHVALRVSDMDAARRFYVDILGFELENDVPGEGLYLTTGTDSLALLHGPPARASGCLDHIGVMVADAEQVAAWERHLKGLGVKIVDQTEAFDDGSVGCSVLGPAGVVVQFLWRPAATRRLGDGCTQPGAEEPPDLRDLLISPRLHAAGRKGG